VVELSATASGCSYQPILAKEILVSKQIIRLSLLLLLVVAGYAMAQEVDAPLKKAKVGDYVVFKMSGPVPGTMRQEVTAVSDKEVTIKTTSTINGMALPAEEKAFPITSKPDAASLNKDVKIVAESMGQETLKINGKEYKCKWRAVTTVAKAGGMEVKSEGKVWISMDAPVFGMVKTESKTFGMVTVVELAEVGNRK
jgi:hypothetical protein